MKRMLTVKRACFFALSILVVSILLPRTSHAASPIILITWQAKSYVPSDYPGKILPTAGSSITASVSVIDGGRPADLSAQQIYWYVNDTLIASGRGVQTASFNAAGSLPGSITLRVRLSAYKGTDVFDQIYIPVAAPEATIAAPYANGTFFGSTISAKALPYFFNVSDTSKLAYSWNVNGETPTSSENPDTLSVNFDPSSPVGSTVLVALTVSDPANPLGSAEGKLNLIFGGQ